VAKNSTKNRNDGGVQRISTVDNPNQSSMGLFVAALGLILVGGIAATVFLANQRESNIDVAPKAQVDHWHSAYLIHDCGNDLPPTSNFDTADGLHTHGAGLLHLHPFNPSVSGRNATLGEYFAASGAALTDESFTTGFADVFPTTLSEADGCNGEEAELQLAVWRNAFDETAEPEIITEGLADFQFETAGMALTLALLPKDAEIPKPPADRIAGLAETGPGGPIEGVAADESPFVTTSTLAPETDDEGTEDSGGSEDVEDPTDDGTTDSTEADS
jgi:hypothetical protein